MILTDTGGLNLGTSTPLALGANNLTMTGSIGATGARATKVWATDIESTNMPTVGGTPIVSKGFMLTPSRVGNVALADATTFYYGNNANNTDTTGTTNVFYTPIACTLKACAIMMKTSVTGSAETSTAWLRVNDTTDNVISSTIVLNAATNTQMVTGLNVSLSAGDFFIVKWTTPTWATNPTSSIISFGLYFE